MLGLGASLSLCEEPNPLVLVEQAGGPQFIEYAGLCDVERVWADVQPLLQRQIPVLFHPSFINFCGTLANDDHWLAMTAEHVARVQSPWFAQDCAYCHWGAAGYSSQFGYFIGPILNRESLDRAIDRVNEVKAVVRAPLLLEPPPVTYVVGSMAPLQFFGELAEATDCGLLFDIGHLYSYELATGLSTLDQLKECPVNRVAEVHVAGGKVQELDEHAMYLDAHEQTIVPEVMTLFRQCLPHFPQLKAVCFECESVSESRVLEVLGELRESIVECSSANDLVAKVQESLVIKESEIKERAFKEGETKECGQC